MKEIKHKRIIAVSLLGITLLSLIIVGFWALMRLSTLTAYAQQIVEIEENGTGLQLTLYGDPEQVRGGLEMFQSFEIFSGLHWEGALPQPYPLPPGPPPPEGSIELDLTYALLEKIGDNDWTGEVTGLDLQLEIADLVNVVIQADMVAFAPITFGTSPEGLPTLTMTADLTGNVYVSLFISVFPLPGFQQVLYEFSGDEFIISITLIKPIDISIETPSNEDLVNGMVSIEARVITAPGIQVEQVDWWANGKEEQNKDSQFGGPMWNDDGEEEWSAEWHTYDGHNGWYEVGVRATGIQEGVEGGFRYNAGDAISVEVDNPWVASWLIKNGDWEDLHGIGIQLEENGKIWQWHTWFSISPEWTSVTLTAPEFEWGGDIRFEKWFIPDTPWESWDLTITIDPALQSYLYNGGRARPILLIYVPAT